MTTPKDILQEPRRYQQIAQRKNTGGITKSFENVGNDTKKHFNLLRFKNETVGNHDDAEGPITRT